MRQVSNGALRTLRTSSNVNRALSEYEKFIEACFRRLGERQRKLVESRPFGQVTSSDDDVRKVRTQVSV